MKMARRGSREVLVCAVVGAAFVLAVVGWSQRAAQAQSDEPVLAVPVTMYDLMTAVVAPAANPIWELSYAAELSDEDWQRISQASIQLATSATLVSLGAADNADEGWTDIPGWQGWARELADTALAAKRASDDKDQIALQTAGDILVAVCEACHLTLVPITP